MSLLFPLSVAVLLAVDAAAGESRPGAFPAKRVRAALCEILGDGHLVGSGFFVDEKGTCLTCAHALLGKKRLELLLADGRRLPAERGAVDEASDAAVLFAKLPEKDRVPFLQLSDGGRKLGQRLFLGGTPVYRHHLFLTGRVASLESGFEYSRDLHTYIQVFYISGMAPRGTSGGPWLDASGHVVGLQSGGMAKGDAFWGVAFAVPVRPLRALLAEPRRNRAVGDLGAAVEELWEQPPATVKRFSKKAKSGLLLRRVLMGGACDRCGLDENHLILSADGRPCRYRKDLLEVVRARKKGEVVRLELLKERGGSLLRVTVPVTLGSSAEAAKLSVR